MKVYYDESYTASSHSFDTTRKSANVAEFVRGMAGVEIVAPTPATQREIALVHDPKYVRAVRTGKGSRKDSAGFGWDPGLWTGVSASTGGAVDAALAALHDGAAGSLSSGLHHADRKRGTGFCTFNGLALAAKIALGGRPLLDTFRRRRTRACRRVLILDLDAHCGGGTYDIIKDDPRIWQIDVSVSGFDAYNASSERHHLHIIQRSADYLDIIELELERAAELGFDLVIYNAGMDPHEDCGIGGLKGISSDVIRRREEMVFGWAREQDVPIAFVLAGGYTGFGMWEKRLSALHGMTVAAAAGTQMPDIGAIEADPPEIVVEERSSWTRYRDEEVEEGPLDMDEEVMRELAQDLGLYGEPWEEEERVEYKSIHELPQEFFDPDNEELRAQYPEFFD